MDHSQRNMRALFAKRPIVSGFVATERCHPGQGFRLPPNQIAVVGQDHRLRLTFDSGPVTQITALIILGSLEVIGLSRSTGQPVLLSGVLVNNRPFAELCLEWQRELDA